jgi:hypothetical protein
MNQNSSYDRLLRGGKTSQSLPAAAAYIIAPAALSTGFGDLPGMLGWGWALRLVILLVLVGFPIALILRGRSTSPQGVRATPDTAAPRRASPQHNHADCNRRGCFGGRLFSCRASLRIRSINQPLPLPFENLSDDKENAYHADGIQDDVLTNLSKISDFRVISRTSVRNTGAGQPNY